MRRLRVCILIAVLLLSALPTSAAGSAVFSFSAASTVVAIGDTFSVPVSVVPNGSSINVVRMAVNFPAALLRINSFTLGTAYPFLSPPGMTIDNTAGYANIGGYLLNNAHTSTQLFGTLSVTALAAGTATISLQPGSHLISPDQQEQLDLVTPQQITFTIGTPPPPANQPPVFSPIGTQQVTVGNAVSFNLNASDPDGDTVTLAGGPLPAGAVFAPSAPGPAVSGVFSWTPSTPGTYSATFTATDNDPADPRSSTITVTIQANNPTNSAPAFTSVPAQTVALGQQVAFSVHAADTDVILLSWTLPAGAAVSAITNNAPSVGAQFAWTPTAQGVYYAVFSAADNSPYGPQSATLTVPIYVNIPANNAPSIDPLQEIVANAGESIAVTVHAHDTEAVILSAVVPDGATFTVPAPAQDVIGGFSWTPEVNGIYTIVFTAQDTNAFNPMTATRTLRIIVFGGTCPQITPQSCGTLAAQTCPASIPADQLTCAGATQESEPVVKNSAAPHLYSLTHPSPENWYDQNSPEVAWELPAMAAGAAVSIDQSPEAYPGTGIIASGTNTFRLARVTDGDWYAHVRAKFAYGWSPVAHLRMRVDTQPPRILPPTVEQLADSKEARAYRVNVSAVDTHSGIREYAYAIDSDAWQIVSFPYVLTAEQARGGRFNIRVTDRAGNEAITSFDLNEAVTRARVAVPYVAASPLEPPVVHPHYTLTRVGLFIRRAALVFTGTAPAHTDVITHLADHRGATRSDRSGDWIYAHITSLPAGTYTLWAHAQRDGIASAPSNSLTVTLDRDFIAYTSINWWLILCLILLMVMCILIFRYVTRDTRAK